MIYLRPVSLKDIDSFEETSFDQMSHEERITLINDSIRKQHDDRYFEFMVIFDDDQIVGFMNMFAQDTDTISIGPEIKESLRRNGYGYQGEFLAIEYAERIGFKRAVAYVKSDNMASISLHEKLGFHLENDHFDRNGSTYMLYVRNLGRYEKDGLYDSIIGSTVSGRIDRPIGSHHPIFNDMIYPVNYGYVTGIYALDGEEQDVYVLGTDEPMEVFEGTVIAVYHRTDDIEDKWIVSLNGNDYSDEEIMEMISFQEKYFDGELIR